MFLLDAFINIITCRWYKILTSEGFTIAGEYIDAATAFRLYQKHIEVRYRSVPITKMLDTVYETEIEDREYFVTCGYIEDKDLFVSLKYKAIDNISNDCSICLHSLNEEFPVRVYGEKCFHDIHLNCLNNLKEKTDFPCCSGRYEFASHTNISHIILSKLSINIFAKHCLYWKDVYATPNHLIYPDNILDYIKLQFPSFIKFCSMPYHNTVKSYHNKWLSKNKVKPI